jgi:hypothetical protein
VIEVRSSELARTVEAQYGGHAVWRAVGAVNETVAGQPVWQGIVHVFDLDPMSLSWIVVARL